MDRLAVRVALTRELGRNDELRSWLPGNADVREIPLTQTRFDDHDDVRARLAPLGTHQWATIVVTSARSAPYVPDALALAGTAEVFSVGPATTRALSDVGVDVAVQSLGGASDLAPLVHEGAVLLLGAATMRPELADALHSRGLIVDVVSVYRTVPVVLTPEARRDLRDCDVVFVGAPSAWAVARGVVRPTAWIVVPGATTARAVEGDHARVITGWDAGLRQRWSTLAGDGTDDVAQ